MKLFYIGKTLKECLVPNSTLTWGAKSSFFRTHTDGQPNLQFAAR